MMKRLVPLAVLLAVALSGCSSDKSPTALSGPLNAVLAVAKARFSGGQAGAAAIDPVTMRAKLEAEGRPAYLVAHPSLGYANVMTPYGRNGDVQTWASPTYETVSLRDGILVATRGFGADMMTSSGPSLGQIAAGIGTFSRSYYYLDGADKARMLSYACILTSAGSETVTLLAKSYATRKVVESCSGPDGAFLNAYWFAGRTNLMQSSQMIAPGLQGMILQRIVD